MRLNIKSIWHSFILTAMLFVFCSNAWSQDIVVTGTITDGGSGDPLPGVNVVIVGSQQGTVTSIDGFYEISVPSDASLSFSFIGFNLEEVAVAGRTSIDVQLIPDIQALDEVVVVGYGTMRKKDLTGAVSSVKKADIAANNTSDALGLLQGKVAGLDLRQESGQTGTGLKLTMRGTRSINAGNQPLIIVDGVEYGSTTFDDGGNENGIPLDINSSDIQSIDVLKDAASTAIYGTRGANGVIIITTKSGGSGKVKVSYNTWVSHNSPAFLMHIQNGAEYAQKYIEKAIADEENGLWADQDIEYDSETGDVNYDPSIHTDPTGMFGSITEEALYTSMGLENRYQLVTTDPVAVQRMLDGLSIDYLDLIMTDSWSQNHELSITGGDEKTAFNLSFGFIDDKGLLRKDELNRYNVKLGLDHKLTKSLKIGTDILFTKKYRFKRNSGIFNAATKSGPIGVLLNDDGTYNQKPDGIMEYNQTTPMLDEVEGAYIDEVFENRLFGSAYVNWDIMPGLSFRSSLGTDFTYYKEGIFKGPNSLPQAKITEAESQIFHQELSKYTWDNVLNYKKSLGANQTINVMLGSSVYTNEAVESRMFVFGQPVNQTQYYDFNGATSLRTESDYQKQQMLSYFGRVNYNIMDKYLLQTTIRTDGASVLDPDNRWASFPSASAGWRVSEEDFMKDISLIDNMKLRYSWGIAGNAAIVPYQSITKLGDTPNYYSFGSVTTSQYVPLQVGNKNLTWEKTSSHNIGLDFSLANYRIVGSVDYYMSQTNDLLFQVPIPLTNGFSSVFDNVAKTENKGVEIGITTVNIEKKSVIWSTDWTFALNRNKVLELRENVSEIQYATSSGSGFDLDASDKIWRVGEPVNSFFTYEVEGIYSIQDFQDELDYVAQQHASGNAIAKSMIPMLSHEWFPGNIKLKDLNEDGEFTVEDKVLKNAEPDFFFSISNHVSIKTKIGDFGLDIHAIGRVGQHIANGIYTRYKSAKDWTNGPWVDAWTPTNTGTIFPRWSGYGNGVQSTYFNPLRYQEASYLKIKEITLSYSLPAAMVKALPIEGLRVYVSAKNFKSFTFSNLENYDPENGGSINFPLSQQIFMGLNLDF